MSDKPRRRQAGEGTISEYELAERVAANGRPVRETRFLIKLNVVGPDGQPKTILRRKNLAGEPFTTRKEAAAGITELRNKSSQPGGFTEPSKLLTRDYFAQWLDGLRVAPATMASYRRTVRLHVAPYVGSTPLARLTTTQLTALYRKLETTGRADGKEGGLSAKSVRYVSTVVGKALKDAVDSGDLRRNPATGAKIPSAKDAKSAEMRTWSAGQLAVFREWSITGLSTDLRTLFLLGFATGARRGELLALRWRDVNLETGRLSVRRSIGGVRHFGAATEMVEGTPKSGKARAVDIDPTTVELLRQHKRNRAALTFALATGDSLIFANEEGQYLRPDSVSGAFVGAQTRCRKWQAKCAAEQAGGKQAEVELLPRIRFHDIRHSSATLLLEAGVPTKVVSERLGHSSAATTEGIYLHVTATMQRGAADALGRAIFGA